MKQTPHVPELFKRIMENHRAIDELLAAPVADMKAWRQALIDRRIYREAAEKALAWNTDKGRTA